MIKARERFTADESSEWLAQRMARVGFTSLEALAEVTGIDRGSLSRYFRHERRPSIDVVAPLSAALSVSPQTLLIALGALDRRP